MFRDLDLIIGAAMLTLSLPLEFVEHDSLWLVRLLHFPEF